MADCDKWIQQLAEGQKVLQPWAPGSGDAQHAAAVFDRFVLALSFLEETVPAPRWVMQCLNIGSCNYMPSMSILQSQLNIINQGIITFHQVK